MVGFIFGGDTGVSYDDLQSRRQAADALAAQIMGRQPRNTMEGIGALLQGAAAGIGRYRAEKGLAAGRKEANSLRDAFFDRITGGGASSSGGAGSSAAGLPMPGAAAEIAATAPGGSSGGDFSSVAPRLIGDLSKDFGLSPEQAAGVVGQLGHESAGFGTMQEVKPMIPGSRGGYGYAQWTGPRRKAFEAWSAENNLDPSSYEANYGFLSHELKNTPEGKVLESVRQAPDARSAGRAFTDEFLRPGIPGYGSRDKWTQRALAFAPDGTQVASADPATGVGVAFDPVANPFSPERESAAANLAQQANGAVAAIEQQAPQFRGSDYNSPMATYDEQGMRVERPYTDPMVSAPNAQPMPADQPQGFDPARFGGPLETSAATPYAPVQPQQASSALTALPSSNVGPAPAVASPAPQQVAQAAPMFDRQALELLNNPFLDDGSKAAIRMYMQQQMGQQQQAQEEQTWRARQEYINQQQQADPLRQAQLAEANARANALQNPARPITQDERQAWGITDNRPYAMTPNGPEPIGGSGQTINFRTEIDARRQAATELGIDPNSEEGKRYILTGNLPAGDRGVTAGDREAIRDADDQAQAALAAVDQLQGIIAPGQNNGPSLNDRAGSGSLADWQAWAARNDPTGFFDDAKGEATTELNNTVLNQALGSLKAIFGAAPTEGERQILLDLQASTDKTPAERKIIVEKGIALANRRLAYNRDRAAELRGGTYYRPRDAEPNVRTNPPLTPDEATGLPARSAPDATRGPRPGVIEDGYRFKGGNASDPANWEKVN